jgi:hypothetical protein
MIEAVDKTKGARTNPIYWAFCAVDNRGHTSLFGLSAVSSAILFKESLFE